MRRGDGNVSVVSARHPHRLRTALLIALLVSGWLSIIVGDRTPVQAALEEGGGGAQVLIGADDDNPANPTIQPPGAADQSLSNTDVLVGGAANDILIGLGGSDVLDGGPGNDILIGGPEGGKPAPKSDIQFGGPGNDIAIWAPGDGSDAFIGGQGRDALVFGVIDRDASGVPTLSDPVPGYPHGVPTANVSGQGGFCTLEQLEDGSLGFEFLVRFFVKATGALAVTIRVSEVEQVFCTSETAAAITFADLTAGDPEFVVVTPQEVTRLNHTVARIIR